MHSVAVSPDGAFCVCGGASGRAFLWDLSSGALLRVWAAHYKRVGAVAFSPCGTVVVTGGDDGVVQVWAIASLVDVADQADLSVHPAASATWADHSLPITSLRFGPGLGLSATLVSTSLDRTARVWDVASGRCLFALSYPSAAHASCVDPLGRRLYVACSPDVAPSGAAGSGGGRAAAVGSSVCVVDLHAAAAHSADPAAMLLGGKGSGGATAGDYDPAGFADHAGAVNDIATSPDGGVLLTAGQDGNVRVWDTETRACVQVFDGHHGSPVVSMVVVARSSHGLGGSTDAPGGAAAPLTPLAPLRKHQVPMPVEWKGSTTGPLDAVVVVARPPLDAVGVSGLGNVDSVFSADLGALLAALDAASCVPTTAESDVVGGAAGAPEGADASWASAPASASEVDDLRRRVAQLEDENKRWKAVNSALLQRVDSQAASSSAGATAGGKRARDSSAAIGGQQ